MKTRPMPMAPASSPPPILRAEATTRTGAFPGFVHPDRRETTGGLSSRRAQPDPRQQLIDFRGSIP
jgi:hypothetical protein